MTLLMKHNLFCAAVGSLLFLTISVAAAAPIVQIDPVSQLAVQGDSLSVDVIVSDVTDLYAFQFDLVFDPTLLQATSSSEGLFLPSGGTTFFVPGAIDNVNGIISFIADTLISPVPGVTGSGDLAAISFTALASGTSILNLSNVLFLDSALNEIGNLTATGGSVTIDPRSTPVPEPSTLGLLALGLIVLRYAKNAKLR
jgi:hypothetical protein